MIRTRVVLAILACSLAAAEDLVGQWVLDRAAVDGAKVKPLSGAWTGEAVGAVHFSETPLGNDRRRVVVFGVE